MYIKSSFRVEVFRHFGFKYSGAQGFKYSGVPAFSIPAFRRSGVPAFRRSGVPAFRPLSTCPPEMTFTMFGGILLI